MKSQPENCVRCGAKLQIDGEPCYQRNCNYYKAPIEEEHDGFDSMDDNDSALERYFNKKAEERQEEAATEKSNIFFEDNEDSTITTTDEDNRNDSDSGFFEDIGDGCISGFFKLIWKIITLPFRILFKIFELFD